MQTSSKLQCRVLASRFEQLYAESYIIGTTNGSNIPILAHVIGREDSYYIKSFHSTILQEVVGPNYIF